MPIFQEHFINNESRWTEKEDDSVYMGIREFGYVLEHKRERGNWTSCIFMHIDADISYQVHTIVEKMSGINNNGYGLIWRRGVDGESGYWTLEVSGDGHYRVSQWKDSQWHNHVRWTRSDKVRKGDGVNELVVTQTFDSATIYINGEEMVTVATPPIDDAVDRQAIGFIVNNRMKIKAHSIAVYRDDGSEALVADTDEEFEPLADEELHTVMDDLNKLIGLTNVKAEIETLVNFLKIQRRRQTEGLQNAPITYHMVLLGPPGTGKTTIARLIGRIYHQLGFLKKGHVIETDRSGLVAEYIGQTAPKVDKKVREALHGVLFVDEAYALKKEDSFRDFGSEAIEALLKRMEDHRGELAVIIAGYTDEMERFIDSNPGLRSRFNRFFYFDHYSPEELMQIFRTFTDEAGYLLSPDGEEKLLAHFQMAWKRRSRTFGNGRYARNLLEKCVEQQANRIVQISQISDEALMTLTADDIPSEPLESLDKPVRPMGFGVQSDTTPTSLPTKPNVKTK